MPMSASGFKPVADLKISLQSIRKRAWVSAVAQQSGRRWKLSHLTAVIGKRPAGWEARTWKYNGVRFISSEISSGQLAALLESGTDSTLSLANTNVQVPPRLEMASISRSPSVAQHDELDLPWPTTNFILDLANQQHSQASQGFFVGENCPSFPTFGAAYNGFFYNDLTARPTSGLINPSIKIRLINAEAYIRRLRVTPGFLDVWVSGSKCAGTRLEFTGSGIHKRLNITKASRYRIGLPNGLENESWVWLTRKSDWLDYRVVSGWGAQATNVEYELSDDPLVELEQLIANGEGLTVEFKEKLPETKDEKRNTFKTVVAFANQFGGTLIFGVEDGGGIVGIDDQPAKARETLMEMVRSLVLPTPNVRPDIKMLGNRHLIILKVPNGSGILHSLVVEANKPEYYVRRGATTFYARPEEITDTVMRGIPGDPIGASLGIL